MAEIDYNTVIAAMRKGNPGDPGAKGDPGSGFTPTFLLAQNLNDVIIPGMYKAEVGAVRTVANNYPVEGYSGTLEVQSRATGSVIQIYIPVFGVPAREGSVFYQRVLQGGTWSPWRTYTAQRVDSSAGKAIYTYDDVANVEQLIYGDTGWRSVPTLLFGDFVNTSVIIRRQGYQVTVGFDGVKSDTISGHTPFFLPPQGFKPDTVAGTGNQRYTLVSDLNGSNIKIVSPDANTNSLRFLSYVTGLVLHGSVTYMTREPWPTTLPGTAVGAIPNT